METTETKFRNHISIVIERFGTIFIGIVIVLAGSALDDLKEIVKHMDNLKEHLADEFAGSQSVSCIVPDCFILAAPPLGENLYFYSGAGNRD